MINEICLWIHSGNVINLIILCSGSATGERNNEWYGESGRDSALEYNTDSVLLSKAGVAISGYIIKEQIQAKIKAATQMETLSGSSNGK